MHAIARAYRSVRRALGLAGIAAVAALCAATSSHAQGPSIGADLGGGVALISSSVPIYADDPACGVYTTGTQSTLGAGIRFDLPAVVGVAGVMFRAGYSSSRAMSTAAPMDPLVIYDVQSDSMVDIPREYALEFSDRRVDLGVALALPVLDRLTVSGGARVSLRMSSEFVREERITGGDMTYTSGERRRDLTAPTAFAPNALAIGFTATASYRIDLGGMLSIEPTVGVDIAPMSSVANLEWYEYRATFALPVMFSLRGPLPAEPVAITPAIAPQLESSGIDASIRLQAVDANGAIVPAATISVYRTMRRSRVDIAKRIAFGENSAVLPPQYGGGRIDFDSTSLADPAALARRSLDVVGWRLQRNAGARIILAPSTSAGEPSWLNFARAESVRAYLEERWDIERGRIEIRPGARRRTGGQASRRVDLIGVPGSLLGAYVAERVETAADPPLVQLKPSFAADAGVSTASVVVLHEGRSIGEFDAQSGAEEAELNWQISPSRVDAESELRAELRVTDARGNDTAVASTLPVRLTQHERSIFRYRSTTKGVERIEATLFEMIPVRSARNAAALDDLVRELRAGARIIVDGSSEVVDAIAARLTHTDRISVRPGRATSTAGRTTITVEQPLN